MGTPRHRKCLQQSDAPNLSSRQVNLRIIYFYVLSKGVDSSRRTRHAGPAVRGVGPAAPAAAVGEPEGKR